MINPQYRQQDAKDVKNASKMLKNANEANKQWTFFDIFRHIPTFFDLF